MEGTAPEVKLPLDSPLREELKPGAEIAFTGVPLAFRQNPWTLVFEVKMLVFEVKMLVFEVKLKDLIRP